MTLNARRTVHVFSCIPRLSHFVREKLPDANVVEMTIEDENNIKSNMEEEIAALKDAEILLVDNFILPQLFEHLPKVQWVQGTWAGVEGLIKHLKDKPKPAYPITRMVNKNFSQQMAEYVIGWIITHERSWLECRQNQLRSAWLIKDNIGFYRTLWGLTVGILGMGNIGKEVARFLKTFNSTVHAFTRTPPSVDNKTNNVDKYWHTGELQMFLEQCDYIVNVMPSTPETRGMLGGETLKYSKKNAVLINVGRGNVISETDLINALDSDWISAAILDVFIEEPLPAENPLWKHPKVVITPHTAAISHPRDVADAFATNFRRFTQGLPVMYTIDWKSGY